MAEKKPETPVPVPPATPPSPQATPTFLDRVDSAIQKVQASDTYIKVSAKASELLGKANVFVRAKLNEALQKNAAHCKLEVLDHNDQIRLLQRALYEEDHHELGILFVQDEKNWEDEAV